MKENSPIQNSMFLDFKNKEVFEKVKNYGFEYLDQALERNVYPTEKALEDLTRFDEAMPAEPANAVEVIDFLNKYGSPATVSQIGGRYFGFVNGGSVPAGMAAKQLATYWDQNTAMYVISPLSAKLESVVERWLKDIFNLPDKMVASFVSGTSLANFCGLAAARYRIFKNCGWDVNQKGLFEAPKIRIFAGRQAHSTILKAVSMLGFGTDQIEWAETDQEGRILLEKLPVLDDKTILILQAGNVNSGSYDPFDEICDLANKAGAWVHIDGAFGLWAAATGKLKHLTKGIEKANSLAVDGHKTLNTPYDCGIALCDDKEALISALHMTGGYLILNEDARDGMFYTPEMSRRARVIELWATLKYLGQSGLAQMIETMHRRTRQFAEEISRVKGFKVLNEVVFNQVVVSCENDELTAKTVERIQALRECWVGGSVWQGKKVIRVSVCSWATTAEDISRSVRSFEKALPESEQD